MKDVCIEFYRYEVDIRPYHEWIRGNVKDGEFYIPKNTYFVYFLNETDLLAFTIIFGKVYKYKAQEGMSKVEKMILHEHAIENRYKKNEKF